MTARPASGDEHGVDLILDVGPVTPPLTGIGNYTLELARRLPTAPGVASVRYTAHGRWVTDLEGRLASPPVTRMPRSSPLQTLLRPVHYAVRLARGIRQGFMYRRHSNALFHGTNFELPDFRGRSVVTVHDLSVLRFPHFHPAVRVDVMERAFSRLSGRAAFLIAVSEFTRRELIELLQWPADRVRTIHLGVRAGFHPRGPEETAPVLGRLSLSHGTYTLCVASIEPRKNISGLIAAYAKLPDPVRRRHPLVLVGHSGWNSRGIHRDIRRFVGEGWLRYLGYLPDDRLPELMAGARGFAYPSFYEGFGLPVVEAMASGIPVVTSDRSSLPEVTAGAALLVDPGDPDDLAAGIRRMLEDDEWRENARRRSLEVAGGYTWDSTIAETVDVYRTVAQDSGLSPISGERRLASRSDPPAPHTGRRPDPPKTPE